MRPAIPDNPKRFGYGPNDTVVVSQCIGCRHKRPNGAFCDAFPDGPGIPDAILRNRHDHHEPFPGDHGVRFEPVESNPKGGEP